MNVNTYVIALNGAVITDLNSGEILREGFIDDEAYKILDTMVDGGFDFDTIAVIEQGAKMFTWYTTDEYNQHKAEIKKKNIHDIVMRANNEAAAIKMTEFANRFISTVPNCKYTVHRSFDIGVEILRSDLTKGAAARCVAEKIGAKLLIGVGDFENDIPLIKEADIGYAVDNATDALKKLADRITVSVTEGAIASIITELEKKKLSQ